MKILFVCTGNTCRSNMAEAIFNKLNTIHNVEAFSAGLSVVPNSKTSKNSSVILKETLDLDISERAAIQLMEESLEEVDLVLTMTSYMRDLIISNFPNFKNKIFSLKNYVGVNGDIVDPFGGDMAIYKNTFEDLKKHILLLMDKLKEDKGIN